MQHEEENSKEARYCDRKFSLEELIGSAYICYSSKRKINVWWGITLSEKDEEGH